LRVSRQLRAHPRQRAYDAGRFEEARSTWAPLAEAGDPEAQAGLGLLYDLGQGVPRDAAKAYSWYKRAADAGLARALFNVAVMHDSGTGVPRDTAQAATWYARAAARGHGRAQYNLAPAMASRRTLPKRSSGIARPPMVVWRPLPPSCRSWGREVRARRLRPGSRPAGCCRSRPSSP
jgi:TPR repeat protein